MSDDDIPEIPATGEEWIDTQIRAVLDATATEQRSAAFMRALALRALAQLSQHALVLRDARIAELEADAVALEAEHEKAIETLREEQEDRVSDLEKAREKDREGHEARIEDLEKDGEALQNRIEALEDDNGHLDTAADLARAIARHLGTENVVDETIDVFNLRRTAEDLLRAEERKWDRPA